MKEKKVARYLIEHFRITMKKVALVKSAELKMEMYKEQHYWIIYDKYRKEISLFLTKEVKNSNIFASFRYKNPDCRKLLKNFPLCNFNNRGLIRLDLN